MAIYKATGGADVGASHKVRPDWIVDRLAEPRMANALLALLPGAARTVMGLFAVTESSIWSAPGLGLAIAALGLDPDESVNPLLETRPPRPPRAGRCPNPAPARLLAHPAAMKAARTILPDRELPTVSRNVRQVREADGLEPILRIAAVWQRVVRGPPEADSERLVLQARSRTAGDDPVVAGPISDAFEPLPDMALLWIELARRVGLLADEPGTDGSSPSRPPSGRRNAVHLPQMVATRWLRPQGLE